MITRLLCLLVCLFHGALSAPAFAALLEDYLFFQPRFDTAVLVEGTGGLYLHLSEQPIDERGRKILRFSKVPEFLYFTGTGGDIVGIWDESKREFAPLPPNGVRLDTYGRLVPYARTLCENPILLLPKGPVETFFGDARQPKPKEIPAFRNTTDCFNDSADYYSSWMMRFWPPEELVFRDGFSVEAIKIEVHRSLVFRAGGSGLWQTFWFAKHLGLIKYEAGPMHDLFGDPRVEAIQRPISWIYPPILTLFPFQRARDYLVGTELRVLPPIQSEGTVVEYRNTLDFPGSPGGQFFYTASPSEQAFIDRGGAGRFLRTGRTFKAGGPSPVCRFYGSVTPGPNSHFYTALTDECRHLKSIQAKPTPTNRQQWNSEGNGFYAVAPYTYHTPDGKTEKRCPLGTQPVYRAYNKAYTASGVKNPWDSNHRLSTERSDITELVNTLGWLDEGVAFCVPL